jgi:hypothetical protein
MNETVKRKILDGKLSRTELVNLRDNAEEQLKKGNPEAQEVIDLINSTTLTKLRAEYVFMGFCPDADFKNRQDIKWKADGICTYDFFEDEKQTQRFRSIMPGDTIILKKRQEFGRTMDLYGYGTVKELKKDRNGERYLKMVWSNQCKILRVPLLACNSTVDVRALAVVEANMPPDFWIWIGSDKPSQ